MRKPEKRLVSLARATIDIGSVFGLVGVSAMAAMYAEGWMGTFTYGNCSSGTFWAFLKPDQFLLIWDQRLILNGKPMTKWGSESWKLGPNWAWRPEFSVLEQRDATVRRTDMYWSFSDRRVQDVPPRSSAKQKAKYRVTIAIPSWLIGVPILSTWYLSWRFRRRANRSVEVPCRTCGYELLHNTTGCCPECGVHLPCTSKVLENRPSPIAERERSD